MINPSSVLTIFNEDTLGNFFDYSTAAADPSADTFALGLGTLSTLYIGYEKPINAVYFALSGNLNVTGGEIVVEYWAGTMWKSLTVLDQTRFFNRSGMISWTAPSDSVPVTINGATKHFISIYGTASAVNVQAQYVGLVFSDDTDIGLEYPSVLKECYYPQNQTNFLAYHVSAKNYIMSELLRRGYTKIVDGTKQPINEWDVLDIHELRQAALYYAMSQIFFNLSDNSSDNYWQKYLEYKGKFDQAFNLGTLRIDQDNDGALDPEEDQPMKSFRWIR